MNPSQKRDKNALQSRQFLQMFPTQSEITFVQNDCKRDVLQDQYNEILFKVPPPLRDNFRILCTNYIGISPFSFENIEYKPIFRQDKYCFYYSLKVRYCTFYLHWDVIFDPLRLNDVPDFIFHNDFFQFYTTKEEFLTRYVPSRDQWDVNNAFSLLTLLIEFHDLYRRVCVADLRSVCLQFKLLQNTTDYLLNDSNFSVFKVLGFSISRLFSSSISIFQFSEF
ncbi:uncharacterized protein LOC135136593 [Zophobas morio]|uniref:uncharacterized protein LOC135136593 n=1 Tax=Zophobas morio TaxID=2755281 RepID=UPI003083C9D9